MAASPVLYVYYPPLNDDSYPGVPARHITEADWASFTIAQRRTIENATTQEGYTRRKVWVHRDLVDETEQERADREAAEQAARDAYERGQSIVRWRDFEPLVPGPGEVIVGSADGPVAVDVSEIVAGKADADHRHDSVYLYATSRSNPTNVPLMITQATVSGRTQLVASIPAAGREGEYGESNAVARADHLHSEGDITGLSARLSAIEARLDALEEPEA